MKVDDVPQDQNPTFKGYGTKAMYALDGQGRYTTVKSSGWEVEEIVLRDVVEDFHAQARDALHRFKKGEVSPLPYYMNQKLMDLPALAGGVGFAKWRVRRHFKLSVFKRLKPKILDRYADFFGVSVEQLVHPEGV